MIEDFARDIEREVEEFLGDEALDPLIERYDLNIGVLRAARDFVVDTRGKECPAIPLIDAAISEDTLPKRLAAWFATCAVVGEEDYFDLVMEFPV